MKDRIIELRRGGLSTHVIGDQLGVSRSYVWRVCADAGLIEHHERRERRDSGQYTPSKRGVELWPTIPFHVRITDRDHTQAIPRALEEA